MIRRRKPNASDGPRARHVLAEIPEVAPRTAVSPNPDTAEQAEPANPSDTMLSEDAIRRMLEAAYT